MLYNDILFYPGKRKLLPRVFQGNGRVPGPMAFMGRIAVLRVIENIIVKKRASHQLFKMKGEPGKQSKALAVIGHRYTMKQPGGRTVLGILGDPP